MTRSGESAEVDVSDHEYEVEHNKRNRPEIPRGGGGKKREKNKQNICLLVSPNVEEHCYVILGLDKYW